MLFWLILAVMTAGSLALVLRPLFAGRRQSPARDAFDAEIYRDQLRQLASDRDAGVIDDAEAEGARIEVSRRLLAASEDAMATAGEGSRSSRSVRRYAAVATLVLVPAVSLGLYLVSGTPGLPGNPFAGRLEQAIEDRDLASLIAQAEAHLRTHPDDARGWRVLAPAYMDQQRFADAANAWARVMDLAGKEPELLTSYGEALVLAEGGLVTEDARTAFDEAVSLDPSLLRARFYLGLADRQEGRITEAITVWKQILAEAEEDAPFRPFIEANIQAAEVALGSAPALSDEDAQGAEEMTRDEQMEMIEGMVANLADRLEQDPDDLDGWLRLINSFVVLGRRDEALDSLRKARDAFAGDGAALARLDELAERHELQETP